MATADGCYALLAVVGGAAAARVVAPGGAALGRVLTGPRGRTATALVSAAVVSAAVLSALALVLLLRG
ncbi:hypothetical protein [Streptomyces sp. CB02959]|uniref:hypothetical protein n=1 Tax=Streptomyces sp. CB02959 TaxID=2020330 RepID=UPI001C60FF7B|nr:hypothetical protein [Streptomyces sp. CB02959]